MKRKILLIFVALVLTAVSCSQPQKAKTISQTELETAEALIEESATSEPSVTVGTIVSTTLTNTDTPMVVETIPDPYDGAGFSLPVIYNDLTTDPPSVVFLEPLHGNEVHRITVPTMVAGVAGAATSGGIFFRGEDYEHIYHLLLDGSIEQLDFLNPDGGPFQGVVLPSSDGKRIAHGFVRTDNSGGGWVQLRVFNTDGSDEQIVLDEYVSARPTRITPIKWSVDGQFLYVMNVIENVGGYGGMDLSRVEIATGNYEEIFANADCLCLTSISPNERYAARVLVGEPLTLVVKDLLMETEASVVLPPDYDEAWDLVWSPDESEMLISVWGFEWVTNKFAVLGVDINDMTVRTLVSDDTQILQPKAWHVKETIWLNDGEGNLWRMDADSLEMVMVASKAPVYSHSR
ncbi:MAG: hypothetical protein K0B06_07845 [Brevefilum sp.]|nr:hypothetical protein [Brevefilum sp.]